MLFSRLLYIGRHAEYHQTTLRVGRLARSLEATRLWHRRVVERRDERGVQTEGAELRLELQKFCLEQSDRLASPVLQRQRLQYSTDPY